MENNIKEEFISTLSHEIRTPLTSIKGFSQTMLNSWDKLSEDKKKEFTGIILSQSQRLINLVENVLNVAKIDSKSNNLVLTEVNANNIMQSCINIIQMAHKDFQFEFNKSKNELFILADNDKTQQILLNILDNAVKYSINSNKIDIKTFNNSEYNVFSVTNYGNFIKESNYEKIFEKFYRVSSYISSTTQGSGLGLYIAKSLVEEMKGKIEIISSEVDKYCTFNVYLPVFEVEAMTKNIGV